MSEDRCLIVGLGNPGREYELTRHNAGFLALDEYAAEIDCVLGKKRFNGLFGLCGQGGRRLLLLKPETYMNRSGLCVAAFMRFYRISPQRLLVLHDDLDLPQGRLKVVARGGTGGHNGIRSLVQELGTRDFARVKIGIGRPGNGENGGHVPVERYVLSRFGEEELRALEQVFSLAREAVSLFVTQGVDRCMNRINGRRP